MLTTRIATAAVGIPVIALCVWVGGALLAAIVCVAVFVACLEIALARGVSLPVVSRPEASRDAAAFAMRMALLAAVAGAVLPAAALAGGDYLLAAVAGVILLLSSFLTFTRDPAGDLPQWLWGVACALYFGALAAHFVLLREAPDGIEWLFFTLITVWVTDTGAYAVGRLIGRHKMAPAVSPGKTWEGAAGAMLSGFATVFVLDAVLELQLTTEHLIALGLLLPPVTMIGDLAESAIKRGLAIKDSSGLVPGHGGIADRLDSLLFAAPVVYWYLRFVIL